MHNLNTTIYYAAIAAIPIALFEKLSGWYVDNAIFMLMVLTSLIVDYLVGTWNHLFVHKDFSIRKNYVKFLTKGFGIVAGYILFEMIYQILKDYDIVAGYIKLTVQMTILLYPTYSGLKNVSILTSGAFPPKKWFDIIERFNTTLDLNQFNTKKNETSTDNSDSTSNNN